MVSTILQTPDLTNLEWILIEEFNYLKKDNKYSIVLFKIILVALKHL